MERQELSFHDQIRLLAYLCTLIGDLLGNIFEICVLKKESQPLMNEISNHERRAIGIHPSALSKQYEEFSYCQVLLFLNTVILRSFSELCAERFQAFPPAWRCYTSTMGTRAGICCCISQTWCVKGSLCSMITWILGTVRRLGRPSICCVWEYFNGFNVLGSVHGFESVI